MNPVGASAEWWCTSAFNSGTDAATLGDSRALFEPVDLNLLGVFDAIYTRGGVTEAARHLNLSQSAISHSPARLREAFGDPLFVRHGNAFVPTAVARAIVEPVRDTLRGIDVALVNATALDLATSTRSFTIGLRMALGYRNLGDALATLTVHIEAKHDDDASHHEELLLGWIFVICVQFLGGPCRCRA